MKNSVRILSVDAKDLFISNNLIKDKGVRGIEGYSTVNDDGDVNYHQYDSTLDYSLDLIKMREVYYTVHRNQRFSFFDSDDFEYTDMVISVSSQYSNKVYNQFTSNIFVKFGYVLNDLELEDNISVSSDGEILAIATDERVEKPHTAIYDSEYFDYSEEKEVYVRRTRINRNNREVKVAIPTLHTTREINEYVYKNGFYCNGSHYVRYKRSAGSSRVGKCLFIHESLYDHMHKYDLCSLDIKECDKIDLAGFEGYISLTLSSIIDTMDIKKENILVIDDYESIFIDRVAKVYSENGVLEAEYCDAEVSNDIFDGQSLIDKDFMGKYKDQGMILLRNRFFKSCCFNTNLQDFFRNHNITSVEQLNGITFAKDIKDIKLITTPNSIKYVKFGTVRQWLNSVDSRYGIVMHESESPFFDGNMVQTHYQLLNTLQFSQEKMNEFLEPTFNHIFELRDNHLAMMYEINYPQNSGFMRVVPNMQNDLVFKLLHLNSDFHKTKIYYDFKKEYISSMLSRIRRGKVLVHGNYSTICGNPIEMLYASIGKFEGKLISNADEIYTTRFKFGKEIMGIRSPHITMGNLWLPTNKYCHLIDKYINTTDEIAVVNSINNNILEKLNGADFDSDTILITNNEILIDLARKNKDKFLVPTSFLESTNIDRTYTLEELADLDIRTSGNRIGEIVNLSQELNSYVWDRLYYDDEFDYLDIYLDICKLSVLSGAEIDSAKREFDINVHKEISDIRTKYTQYNSDGKRTKPRFLRTILIHNGFTPSPNVEYRKVHTSMDYLDIRLNSIARRGIYTKDKCPKLPLVDILKDEKKDREPLVRSKIHYDIGRIRKILKESQVQIESLYRSRTSQANKFKISQSIIRNSSRAIDGINDLTHASIIATIEELDRFNNMFKIFATTEYFTNVFNNTSNKCMEYYNMYQIYDI